MALPPLTADQVNDLIITTTKKQVNQGWVQNMQNLQRYHFLPRLATDKKKTFTAGTGHRWEIGLTQQNAQAEKSGLYATLTPQQVNVANYAEIPFTQFRWYYTYDVIEMISNSQDDTRLADEIKMKIASSYIDGAALAESMFFSKPVDSSDNLTMLGLKYWLVWNAGGGIGATPQFAGGNPSGFSTVANIDSSLTKNAHWRNLTGTVAAYTKDDGLPTLRQAFRLTGFETPVPNEGSINAKISNGCECYTNNAVITELETTAEGRNQNLGNDLVRYFGTPTSGAVVNSFPIHYVPQLDADTGKPMFGLNWGLIDIITLAGVDPLVIGPRDAPNQPTVKYVDYEMRSNPRFLTRRNHFYFRSGAEV